MNTNDIMVLGIGLQAPWKQVNQHLVLDKHPHEMQLEIAAERGSQASLRVDNSPGKNLFFRNDYGNGMHPE